ncbi:MAG: cyclic nucleotide-binding domain-containing protein [Burkholderiales bacterium]|jgi:CRP-like cAMP-binding protein|nr:cyclic nucleotide-binding domain-containing protein [Burkholderiales bacterium]
MNNDPFELLRKSKLAAELTEEQCHTLVPLIEVREYQEGDVLVQERSTDDHLYVLVSGTLSIIKRFGTSEQALLNTITADNFAGELGFMDDTERYASLVATEPSVVFRLKRGNLESLLDTDPIIVYRVMRSVLRVAHQIQHRQAIQHQELTNYLYKQQGRY